jgi:hypothetical protein
MPSGVSHGSAACFVEGAWGASVKAMLAKSGMLVMG